ncbi:hypothetical protein BSKO_03278 [Bryopsis sp. KO-2023]|nr:hypothetical protein BSKO_03278 [Bryopsis sp. KO-2023]
MGRELFPNGVACFVFVFSLSACVQVSLPKKSIRMDIGKEFWKRHVSEEPVKKIREVQKSIQHNNHVNKFVHLAGRSASNTMLTSKLIPAAFGMVGVPVVAYGVYSLWTENSNM